MLALQPFIDAHPPSPTVVPAPPELIERYRRLLPDAMLALWADHGLGFFGDGLVQLINPDDYRRNLNAWLMRDEDDPTRLPIALSGLGLVLYYRRLSDDGDEDVCYLDPHTSECDVLSWSLEECFNDLLCNPQVLRDSLDAPMMREAAARLGPLRHGEIYSYEPALRLGGSKSSGHLARCDALTQLDLLLQLALSAP
ncbi:MAG: DUF1851 domain-containing protein [Burkholderiales bacterium]|nr:DUF1851 domain-containing protein [Burkholderiales bacterium]